MSEELAKEMLSEFKSTSKRHFVIIIILILSLVFSNLAWLYCWSLPNETSTESYELQGSEDANVVYSNQGGVNINGDSGDK